MGRSNYSTNGLLNAVTKRAFNRYTPTTVDYQHLEAATTTSGLVSNRREYSSALLLADKFSLSPLNLAQANYDPFLKSILSTDWEDTLKELSGESGFNTGLDISLTSDGTKLAVITRDKQAIYLNEGNTEIKVYNYDSTRYDLASPENVATHTYQSVSYTISGIDSTDDGHQVVAVLNDQALQKFSLSETNVLTSDTRFSFGPLGGTGDLTVNLSHDGKRVFVFQPGAPARVYEYANLQGGYYTMSTSNIQKGIMSKNGDRFIIKTSQGIETFDVPKQAPNGAVVLERIPATLTYTGVIIGGTPLALSFDGSLMLGLENGNVKLYVWSGVMWKEYVTVVSGSFFCVADISRDGTYVIVGGSGAPVKTFKWDPSTETYNEYGGTTLYAVNNADSISINQNGDKAVIGTNTNTSQIYTLADGTWNRRTTVSGTSGEGKVGCVRVANDGRAFATASDSRITFFGDFTNKQYPVGWTQRGNTVSIPSYVKSIALSDDGNYLIAGLYKESTTFFAGIQANAGKVRVYGLSGSTWSQRGADIEYDTANTFFGSAVAISPDGSKFAAGGNGIVRVFKNEVGTNPTNLKNTISSIALTPQSSLLEMNANGSRLVVNRTIFDNAVAKGGVDSADALNLSNDGNYLAVEANNTASLYGINSQGVVSLVGTSISPTDSADNVGDYRTNTAYSSTKINVNAANSQLLNLASSYGTTTEMCSLTYDPSTFTTTRTTANRILTTESSEITGFASHSGITISRDGGTLAVYDNAKFSIYNYTNSAWTFVRTKTVTSGPYLVVLSHDGSRVAYRDGSLKVENTLTGASLGSISVASLYTYAFKSNTTLALLQGTNDIELYDYDGTNWNLGETISYSGTNSSTSLLWSGDGTRLAAGDSGSNRRVAFFEYDSTLTAPVFSFVQEGSAHTASLQALSGTGDVKVLGTSTGVEIHEASGTATFTGGAATSIDVSIDGTRVVVGTSSKMYVVHKSAGVWTQLGSDITGNAPRVAISRDGSKIFSHDLVLKSYEYVSGSWTTYLPDLTASGATSKVSSSTDGDIVAVGTDVYSKQSVTTSAEYTFNASGSSFSGTEQAVSGNGNVRVFADKSVNSSTGQALIYEKVGGSWSSTASATFTGASATEEFGRDVDVSNDGTRVVIGSATKMVVVEKSGGTWSQLGSDISGSTTKVAISRDGSKVFGYDSSDMKSYEYVSGSWTQYLPDLTGLSSITRLAPSTDGDIVALSKNNANQVYSKQSVTATAGYTISQPVATFQEPGGSVISNNGLVAVTYDNSSTGEVKIFEKDSGGNWPSTASATYTGSSTGEYFGRVLGVSDDGTRVAMQSSSKMMVVDKSATTTTYTVTVASVGGGNRYHIDGVDRAPLTFYRGNTYVFDLSDASNNGHPLVFSPTTTGVVDTGSQITFTVPANAPSSMTYLCQTHGSGMGSTITVSDRVWTQLGSDITASFDAITGSCLTGDGTKVFGSSVSAGPIVITQVGSDIDGEAAGDQSGYSVSMSSDGTRVAIGAYGNDGNGFNSGHVRVYAESGGTWTKVGQDINGEAAGDASGWSVSMSSDGTRVAIGAYRNDGNGSNSGHVRVYAESGGTWYKVGQDIDGEAAGDESGWSVSMSSDGTRVAIGAPYNDGTGNSAGHVRVYADSGYMGWAKVGLDIDGEATNDNSGYSVSMSSDGTRVAIGAWGPDANGSNSGHVRVYSESGGTWTKVGQDIDGDTFYDNSGWSVSMSSDGTRVAIGAPYNDGTGTSAGHVRVYAESGGTWTQVGADIDGEAAFDQSGRSVSMSSDGTRVAIGAPYNETNAGHVRVYAESGGTWTKVGQQDIDGEAASDQSGWSVSMSSDGTRVAIGAYLNDDNGADAGHARVYSIDATPVIVTSSWEYSGGSWSQYRSDITVSNTISRISHSTTGEILGLEDATRTYIYATTGSASTYTKRHADAFYSTQNHSMTDDGANVISGDFSGSRVWNGTNYVYDGASGTNAPWGRLTSPDLVEVSGNGNLVFWVDNAANRFRTYSKSTVNGNVQWTLSTSLAYTYSPVKLSALGSDAIIVTGSGSAGAKIYDITYTAGSTTDQYATRGSSFSGTQIDMSDDGSQVVSTASSRSSTTWNGTDYAYDGASGVAPWTSWSVSAFSLDWSSYEIGRHVYISGDGTRAYLIVYNIYGGSSDIYIMMWNRGNQVWDSTHVTYLTVYLGQYNFLSLNTDGSFLGVSGSSVRFYDIIYNAGTTSDQYVIRGSGLGFGSNHDLSDDGDYVVYTNVSPGTKAWNGSSWAYNGPAATSAGWSYLHTVLALSGDATKAIAFKSSTNEVILYTKDAQHEWSQNATLTQTGVTALSIDTDGSIVGIVANSQTKFYTFGSTQNPIGWYSHSSFQDTAEPGFAQSFDISNDGDAVVVGVSGDGTSSYRGAVRVYDYTSSWALRSTITPPSETAANGNVGYRNLGKSVSVSSDGTKIAYLGDQGTYSGGQSTSTSGSMTITTSDYQNRITNTYNGGEWGTVNFYNSSSSYLRLTSGGGNNNGIWLPVTFGAEWSVSFEWYLSTANGADDMRFVFYAPNQPTSYAGSQHGGYNVLHEFYSGDEHTIRDPTDAPLSTVSTTYQSNSWRLVSISYNNGVLTTSVDGASGSSRTYTFTGSHLSAQQALWGTNSYIAITGRTGGASASQYIQNINVSWVSTTQPPTVTPNRSEASTRDWQNSAWVNPAYASDEVTLTEVVPVSESRDLETVSMSYDGTRFGVRASSGSYDAIVKKLDALVITTTDILGWTKRGDIISFDTTDSVAATTSRSMRSSVDGNTVAFGYVNSSGVKIRVYSFASGSWSQLGSEISTTGTTISMDVSNDGTRVAVLSGDTGRVFAYGGGSWSQFGSSIAFRPTGVNTIKISGNGNYVALGNNTPSDPYPFNILRVYKKNVDWELISPTMTLAKTPSNFFGAGFGLLNDGSRLVHYTDSGVEFASFITTTGTDFVQHSTDITGNGVGSNLAFDNSGSTLVTSSFTDNVIRVYDSSHNQVTTFDVKIMYADIEQPFGSPDAMETKPFAITKDGTKIVTVAPPGVSGLRAIVYKKQNGVWSQEGNTIEITVTDRISSVDITNDGNTVIVGSIDEAANGANPCPGRAQAFTLSNGTWSQLGGTITNPEGNHRFSNVVAISDIGTIVAAGHYTYNGGRPFGVVKTYESKDEIQDISFGPPIIELIGNSYIRLPLNVIYTELGATITTQSSTVPEIKITGTVQTGIPGVYTLRYECEDNLRKTATPVFRQVEIISAVPTFRIKGEPIVYHTKDVLYIDQGIEVFSGYEDGTDFDMFYREPGSDTIIGYGYVNFTPSTEGDWTVYWVDQLVDEYLRTGPLHTRVVRVRERPVITLTGASAIYHRLFDPFVDPGVTITQSSYGFEGTTTATAINPNLSGVYTITYTAVDKFGIEAVTVTRTVDVRERPSITAAQTSFYNILDDPISTPTPTVSPSNLASQLQSSNNIDINARGDYTITHTLTDSVGISAQPFAQQFSVGSHGTLAFSDTGTVFALSKNGGDLAVFDTTLKTYKVQGFAQYGDVATPAPPTSIKFTPDGQYMVVGMASHLTIGLVRVYKKNVTFSSGWEQVGFDLFGTDYLGKFGESVDINTDATRIVVGAPEAGTAILKSGSVKIYDWTGFFWKQSSFVVEGTIPSQLMGFSVSLDNEGTTLAVGSPGHTTTTVSGTTITTANVGKVSVYKLSGSDWQLSGSEIEDGTEGKRNGTSVSLSRSGNVLAVGSVLGGGVRVYSYSTDWTLYGSHVQGSFGESVSLSSNGNTLVAGSKDENKGRVYKYTFGGDGWSRSTDTFDTIVAGEGSTTFLGKKVSLDGSGELLCVSSNTDVRIYLV